MNYLSKRKEISNIQSVQDRLKDGQAPTNIEDLVVNFPALLDQNVRKFHRGDFMTIVGSSGIGKTSFIMWLYKHILLNNPDGICVIVACEMSQSQLINKWAKATKDCPEISSRLYIITAYNDDGSTNDLSIKGIKSKLLEYKSVLDTKILSFICDHLHIIKRGEGETLDDVAYGFSDMCKQLDALGILTAQTTKGKSGEGDMPLDKNSVFGTSVVTWESAYMITLCQPLKTLGLKTFPITSWQLAKNRFKEGDDNIVESVNYLLKFNYGDESYSKLNPDELNEFKLYFDEVLEYRKEKEKTGEVMFDTSYTIKTPSGKQIPIKQEYGSETKRWD